MPSLTNNNEKVAVLRKICAKTAEFWRKTVQKGILGSSLHNFRRGIPQGRADGRTKGNCERAAETDKKAECLQWTSRILTDFKAFFCDFRSFLYHFIRI